MFRSVLDITKIVDFTKISIFSESGIKKLEALRDALFSLQKKEYKNKESSEYSKKMVKNTIEILEEIINHNEIAYWKNSSHQEKLTALIDVLDNYRGTFVPEVFNQESKELAETILKELNDFSPKTHLKKTFP